MVNIIVQLIKNEEIDPKKAHIERNCKATCAPSVRMSQDFF